MLDHRALTELKSLTEQKSLVELDAHQVRQAMDQGTHALFDVDALLAKAEMAFETDGLGDAMGLPDQITTVYDEVVGLRKNLKKTLNTVTHMRAGLSRLR